MIPKEIRAFLEGATVAMGGTRNRNLIPHAHRISGWLVGGDGETLTCLIAEGFTGELIESLEDNGQFALTVCEVPSHETYQFKGVWVGSRPVAEADLAVYESYRERFAERVSQLLGFPEERARAYVRRPSLALSFKVREIFLQTPGPEAGRRLVPREGS
jgi:hypothetical protein